MNINWFPGHMFKTQKEIKSMVSLVDIVVEIKDARAIVSTTNPDIENLTKGKNKIIILSKVDLADKKTTQDWIEYYKSKGIYCIDVDIIKGKNVKKINEIINTIMKDKLDRLKAKGVKNYTIRCMILGIPNVGKSSLINKIANNNIAKVGNRPGVTKSRQWIKTKWGVDMLDTPGILWPKFDNEKVGMNLAYIGSIKDEILDIEELSYNLLGFLTSNYKTNLESIYKVELSEDISDNLDIIGKQLGCLQKGAMIDYMRLAKILLNDFRSGKMGNISLETPNDILEDTY